MVLLVILLYISIGILEIKALHKKNQKKEMALYSVVYLSAFTLSILLNLGVKIPSPAKPIENFVKEIKGLF